MISGATVHSDPTERPADAAGFRPLDRLPSLFFLAAIFLKDIGARWISADTSIALILLGLATGGLALWDRSRRGWAAPEAPMLLLCLAAATFCATGLFTGRLALSGYYLAIPCGFVIVATDLPFFLKLLLVHLGLSLAMQSVEYATGQYFFYSYTIDGTEVNEDLFSGARDILRAKGMFQGPLNAVAFAFWMGFLFRGNLLLAAAILYCSFFAVGRLGLTVGTVLFAFRVLRLKVDRVPPSRALAAGATMVGIGLLLYFAADSWKAFVSTAFDPDNDQNTSRLDYWTQSIAYFSGYTPTDKLFGRHGFILSQIGGTESDWLRLLLDTGLTGLTCYGVAVASLLVTSLRRRDGEALFLTILVGTLMSIFPFIQSISSTLLFWVFTFNLLSAKTPGPAATQEPVPNIAEA